MTAVLSNFKTSLVVAKAAKKAISQLVTAVVASRRSGNILGARAAVEYAQQQARALFLSLSD